MLRFVLIFIILLNFSILLGSEEGKIKNCRQLMEKKSKISWFKLSKEIIDECTTLCGKGILKACSLSGQYYYSVNNREKAEIFLKKSCDGDVGCFYFSRVYLRYKEFPYFFFEKEIETKYYKKSVAINQHLCSLQIEDACKLLGELILTGIKNDKIELHFK